MTEASEALMAEVEPVESKNESPACQPSESSEEMLEYSEIVRTHARFHNGKTSI